MAIFDNLETDNTIQGETDNLGGFKILDSGLYDTIIEKAFVQDSAKGSMGLNLHLKTADNNIVHTIIYITSNKANGRKIYYEKKGKKLYLPNFNLANSLSLLITNKGILTLTEEDKTIKLYNFTAKKAVATPVKMLSELVGTSVTIGLIKQEVDKKTYDKATDTYVSTGESKFENEIDKFFRVTDGLTTTEIKAKVTTPSFKPQWEKKWKDQVRDKTTKTGITQGAPAMPNKAGTSTPAAGSGSAAPVEALFT